MNQNRQDRLDGLRQWAEALLHGRTGKKGALEESAQSVLGLIHELEVHQVELEMQNEELGRSEQRLEASEKKYADLYNYSPVGYFTCDLNGKLLEANLTGAGMLGVDRQHLIGTYFSVYCSPPSADQFHLHQRRALETKQPTRCQLTLRNANGVPFEGQLESIAAQDQDGHFTICQSALFDISKRKKAEEALDLSEELTRLLVEGVKDYAIFTLDSSGHVNSWNGIAEQIKQWRADEIIGQHFSVFYLPEDVAAGKPQRELDIASREGHFSEEGRRRRKDGSVFWADVSLTALRDKHGNLRGFTKMTRDITERKQVEAALRESEERYRMLVETSPQGVVEVDITGKIRYINQAYLDILGHSREALLGKSIWDSSLTSENHATLKHQYYAMLESQLPPPPFQSRVVHSNGTNTDIQTDWNFRRDAQGELLGFTAVISDITEYRRASVTLRQTRNFLENLINHANAPIIVWDSAQIITRFNRASEELTGLRADDVLARPLDFLFPEGRRQDMFAYIKQANMDQHWEDVELPIERTDGQVRMVLWNSAPIHDADNHALVATIVQGQDITDRKRAESLMIEAAENEKRRIGQDLHDSLLQQITGIYYAGQALERRMGKQHLPEQAEMAKISVQLKESIRQARNLAHGLYPALLEQQGLIAALQQLAVEVNASCPVVCRFRSISDRGVKAATGERLMSLKAETHFYRIAQESVQNALKHGLPHTIQICLTQQGRDFTLTIEDDGKGMIGDPANGKGLGLMSMKYRARLIGGKLDTLPREGGGFVVRCTVSSSPLLAEAKS